MKKLKTCIVENCIPTPSSCVEWNGGDIEYLGICNGDSLNNILWEIVSKLEDLTGEDLSQFDIDSLLDICNEKAPLEITISSILTVVKNNQVCLKDYIDTLNDKLTELFQNEDIEVNLRCYSNFDNLGNALSINRAQLDQLVIDNLCAHEERLDTVEGKIVVMQSQIDNIDNNKVVEELSYSTCVDPGTKPTSSQVKAIATAHCALETATGTPAGVSSALSKTPSNFNSKFGLIAGWDLTPANWAENYGNLLLAFNNLLARVESIEQNCCALDCDDIELGFTALINEDGDAVIIRFTAGSGTKIPAGLIDKGSTGVLTDQNGATESFTLTITNNYETEIPLSALDSSGTIQVSITAKIGNDSLLCEKCLGKSIVSSSCALCEIVAVGADGSSAVIVYEDEGVVGITYGVSPTTTTTTTVAV